MPRWKLNLIVLCIAQLLTQMGFSAYLPSTAYFVQELAGVGNAEATRWVTERVSPGSWVLIKGSRAMKMERIAKQTASSFDVSWTAGEKE